MLSVLYHGGVPGAAEYDRENQVSRRLPHTCPPCVQESPPANPATCTIVQQLPENCAHAASPERRRGPKPKFDPKPIESRPHSGPMSIKKARLRANSGRVRTPPDPIRAKLDSMRQNCWLILGHCWPTSGRIWLVPAKLGQILTNF